MAIELLYFAWVRERIGRDGETVSPPAEVRTVAALVDWLKMTPGEVKELHAAKINSGSRRP